MPGGTDGIPGEGLVRPAEPHDGLEPAAGRRQQLDLAAVGLDEPADDREPEAGARAGPAAPEAVEGASALLGASARAPRRRRAARRRRRDDGDRRPARGEASSAFATRLSSTWRSRSGERARGAAVARIADEPDAEVVGRPSHASTRSSTSSRGRPRRAGPHVRRRARARAGRRRAARAARPRRARRRGPPVPAATSRSRFSSRRRSAVSGVRSWCEASATNSSCERSSCSSRPTVSLNSRASGRTSGGPSSSGARAARSPAPTAAAPPRGRAAAGRRRARADADERGAAPRTIAAIASRISQYRRTRASTADVGYVIRTAPWTTPAGGDRHGDVEQVRRACSSGARRSRPGRASAAAISGRDAKLARPVRSSASRRRRSRRRSTTTTRPPVSALVPRRDRRDGAELRCRARRSERVLGERRERDGVALDLRLEVAALVPGVDDPERHLEQRAARRASAPGS